MNSRFSTLGVLLGALALSACGGGANLKFEEQLKADLAASEARVAELQQDVTDALDKATEATETATAALEDAAAAEVRATEAERRADAAVADVERHRQTAETARQEADDAKAAALLAQQQAQTAQQQAQQAEQAAQQAQQQQQQAQQEAEDARQQAQTREANQRAEKLKEAFPGGGLAADLDADDVPDVSTTTSVVSVVSERSRLKLTRGGHRDATLSGSGLRMATMDLTVGGDSGKTVVYTDRELSRPLLDHFGARRDPADMTRFTLTGPLAITPFPNPQISSQWRITHTVPTSVAGVDEDENADTPLTLPTDAVERNTKTATAFSGSLYGKSGQFVCGGADGCQVTATPAYSSTLENSRFALATVTITATIGGTPGGTLYFKPSGSPTLQLYEGSSVGPDEEYMVFGYWREDPTSAAADYQANVFASALADTTNSQTVPGTQSTHPMTERQWACTWSKIPTMPLTRIGRVNSQPTFH